MPPPGNPVRKAWAEGRTAFGIWLSLPGGAAAELAADPALDFACIDQQHGLIGYTEFLAMLQGIGSRGPAPITRVPASDAAMIGKVLDAGALGVVVPMVESAKQAADVVAAFRYPPDGVRSYGPIRAATSLGTREPAALSSEPVCIVMVESRQGIENVDEIAATPGVDAIYIGPADLALALGLPPDLDKDEPEHVATVERIREACARHGVVAGIQCGSGTAARRYASGGFGLVTVTKDSALLVGGIARELIALRGGDGSDRVAYT